MTIDLVVSLGNRILVLALIAFGANAARKGASAAERHLVWMLSLITMIALPVAALLLPVWRGHL